MTIVFMAINIDIDIVALLLVSQLLWTIDLLTLTILNQHNQRLLTTITMSTNLDTIGNARLR